MVIIRHSYTNCEGKHKQLDNIAMLNVWKITNSQSLKSLEERFYLEHKWTTTFQLESSQIQLLPIITNKNAELGKFIFRLIGHMFLGGHSIQ
jgi:hypothetical protein